MPSHILPKFTFQAWGRQVPNAKTAFDWLSRDEAEVAKYVNDPLCGFDVSVATWRTVFDFVFRGADDRNFTIIPRDLPVLLVGGKKDPATDGGTAVEKLAARMRAMGFSDLRSIIYADTRHESLNEVNRDIITAAFAEWARTAVA